MEEKVYEYLKRLVSVPGISDTDEERKTAEAIREILAEQPYFRAYPENFGTVEIPGDAGKRPLVYGLVRGNKKSGRTIILTGHYDVASGEWIFGRDAADMKGGLAAGLAVLLGIGEEVLDGTCRMDGNVLFLSVPDEESYSVGMRGAAGFLADLRERENRKSLLVELPEILHTLIENM